MMNQAIRLAARGAGVPLWRVAKEMRISEPTMTRRLRYELPQMEQEKILSIIDRLKQEGGSTLCS